VTAVVSLTVDLKDGSSVEFGTVGPDGLAGGFFFFSSPIAYGTALVQCSGALYRVPAEIALARFHASSVFRKSVTDYMHFLLAVAAQNSSCYRYHSIEQQLCRTLLSLMDQLNSSSFSVTHEALARALGVRREGVTLSAQRLRSLGFIEYSRGRVEVLSPLELRKNSCECYQALKNLAPGFVSKN
jgi:CRP-like cAMP-binding protein